MRIAFFGTPDFAVPSLEALAREHEITLVVAQPDKPSGRGMKMHAPAVAVKAKELGLPLLQPAKIRTEEFLARVREAAPELGVVVAYGRILPQSLLEIPTHGFVNVHGSVLPKWRGAAPIQRSIEAGETETGVTIMRVDEELDHGAMLAIETLAIGADEHTPSLAARLSSLGAEALARVLRDYANVRETPQDHAAATHAAKLDKSEGLVRWTGSAKAIYDKYRAFDPWPGVFTESMKLVELARTAGGGPPGTVLRIEDDGVVVACGEGALKLIAVQRPGKPRVPAVELARSGVLLP
ncbi:MAG: methionyl-tRNA formyltransferase [Acidobacteria bacterium]|nr:methionyl-tRNA formyltransferase [Acidobacteriota bacterium]